jgi:hypothetical protein
LKRTLLAIIGAALILFILYPIIAAARYKEEPQLFINYAQFHKSPIEVRRNTVSRKANVEQGLPHLIQQANGAYSGRHYSVEEAKDLIRYYSRIYNIDASTPLCIAYHESAYNQLSKNKSSSASGVFQYLSSTWKATDEGREGKSVFDADANTRAAVKYMAIHKSTRPWQVAPKCPTLKFL